MVLVVGATGVLGFDVCRRLAARGEKVRALVRPTSSREKIEWLRSFGVELHQGDLKDPPSLASACRGADAVISTASSTLSRQPGDSIASVDAAGQMNLVDAAKAAKINRFLFVSFPHPVNISFDLDDAKRHVEDAIQPMNFTVVVPNYFMEVWLSPRLGFDYANATARIYGTGAKPISWVSFHDVAEFCAIALRHPAAAHRTIEFGGPEAICSLNVVAIFEKLGHRPFTVEHISEPSLLAQFQQATDPMQKAFAAFMLLNARGSVMNMEPVMSEFVIRPINVEQYASDVLANAPLA